MRDLHKISILCNALAFPNNNVLDTNFDQFQRSLPTFLSLHLSITCFSCHPSLRSDWLEVVEQRRKVNLHSGRDARTAQPTEAK